jgi:hypothetical protein
MKFRRWEMAEIPDNKNKLPVLFFAISACIALAFYAGIVKNETIFYTHFFYIPTILAGLWYHRKAVYVALGLGMVHIFVTFFTLHPVSIDEFGRVAVLIIVAFIMPEALKRWLRKGQMRSGNYLMLSMRPKIAS